MVHNVGQNEGNFGAVRAINNSKPLPVDFLDYSSHLFGSTPYKPVLVQESPVTTALARNRCLKRKPYAQNA